jgi:hypothetical protein
MTYPESARDRLPRDESYPISRSAIDAALSGAGVETVDLIYFLRAGVDDRKRSSSGEIIRIDFRAATRDHPERVELRVYAVPTSLKEALGRAGVPSAVTRAAAWLRSSEIAEVPYRSSDHFFAARFEEDTLSILEG